MDRVKILPVIMAGGRGTRFWPLSRKNRPKQLLNLIDDKPLVRLTYERVLALASPEQIFISTSKELFSPLKKILSEIPKKNFILEPQPRDTAPGIGLVLVEITRRANEFSTEPVLAFLPSDHFIKKPAEFRRVLKRAGRLAKEKNLIVTIGIPPTFPSTGYGYIQPEQVITGYKSAYRVKRFREKPGLSLARRYLKMGFFWNAGIFIVTPGLLWELYEKYQPEMAGVLKKLTQLPSSRYKSSLKKEFPRLKKISFDYAIMERAKQVGMVAGEFGWSDIGGYYAWYQLLGGEGEKNLSNTELVFRASRGNLVRARKLVALVGVEGLAVIETNDILLVMDLKQEAELKKLVEEIKARGWKKYL